MLSRNPESPANTRLHREREEEEGNYFKMKILAQERFQYDDKNDKMQIENKTKIKKILEKGT